jgi:hypothetical protein
MPRRFIHSGEHWEAEMTGLGHSDMQGIPPGGRYPQITHHGVRLTRLSDGEQLTEWISVSSVDAASLEELQAAVSRAIEK